MNPGDNTVCVVKFTAHGLVMKLPVLPSLIVGFVPPTRTSGKEPDFAAITSGGVSGPTR